MSGEPVKNRLPSAALLFFGMGCVGVKGLAYRDAVTGIEELDAHNAGVIHCKFDQFISIDSRVCSSEIERHAAVLGLHPRRERATNSQVRCGSCCVPVIGRSIPLHDVVQVAPGVPNGFDGSRDMGFDGDLHVQISGTCKVSD